MVLYHPSAPPAALLAEVVCPDLQARFRACDAVCTTVWAIGLNSCETQAERAAWQERYAAHLRTLARAWPTNAKNAARAPVRD